MTRRGFFGLILGALATIPLGMMRPAPKPKPRAELLRVWSGGVLIYDAKNPSRFDDDIWQLYGVDADANGDLIRCHTWDMSSEKATATLHTYIAVVRYRNTETGLVTGPFSLILTNYGNRVPSRLPTRAIPVSAMYAGDYEAHA